MNNKGFTLIEALAVIVLLGIVLAIGGYSVANYLSDSKEKSLHILRDNIKSAMINYYNECKYLSTSDAICKKDNDGGEEKIFVIDSNNTLSTTVGSLVEFGFLDNQILRDLNIEELDDEYSSKITNLMNCEVSIKYDKDNKEFNSVDFDSDTCGSIGN